MKAIKKIKEIKGYEDFYLSGRDNYRGSRYVKSPNGSDMHVAQLIKQAGYEKKGLQWVDVASGEYAVKLPHDHPEIYKYFNNLEFDNVWDVFIGSDAVPVKEDKEVRVKIGNGYGRKIVQKEVVGNGYWYGRVHVEDIRDSDDGEVLILMKEVA